MNTRAQQVDLAEGTQLSMHGCAHRLLNALGAARDLSRRLLEIAREGNVMKSLCNRVKQLDLRQPAGFDCKTRARGKQAPIISMASVRHALTLEDGRNSNNNEQDEAVRSLMAKADAQAKLLDQLKNANKGNGYQGISERKTLRASEIDLCFNCGEAGHKSWEAKCSPEKVKVRQAEKARRRAATANRADALEML